MDYSATHSMPSKLLLLDGRQISMDIPAQERAFALYSARDHALAITMVDPAARAEIKPK